MNSGKCVFAQLLQYVNKYEFEKCVNRLVSSTEGGISSRSNLPIAEVEVLKALASSVWDIS